MRQKRHEKARGDEWEEERMNWTVPNF